MSVQAMGWVIEHSRHKGANLLCLLMIANHARSDGTGAWPSIAMLAQECRMSERQIKRIIPLLAHSGELRVDRDKGPRGAHLYTIAGMQQGDKMSPTPVRRDKMSPRSAQGDKMSPPLGDISDALGDILSSLGDIAMSPEPSLEPSVKPSEEKSLTLPAHAHARGSPNGVGDGVSIPADLSPGEEERAHMQALGIPQQWYFAKWWSIVEHYENKPNDRRTIEKWRWTCRHLISEDWAKSLEPQTRSR